jgi:predicted nucleotidyltransferase
MNQLIEQHRTELEQLCRKHHVRTLELFGSATQREFDQTRSDLDVLVEYLRLPEGEHARAFFGLLHDFEDLFHRKIDLVMTRAIHDPYFLRGVNETRRVVYAASSAMLQISDC